LKLKTTDASLKLKMTEAWELTQLSAMVAAIRH
jgi:hypothetical protein